MREVQDNMREIQELAQEKSRLQKMIDDLAQEQLRMQREYMDERERLEAEKERLREVMPVEAPGAAEAARARHNLRDWRKRNNLECQY